MASDLGTRNERRAGAARRYGLALLVTALATAARLALDPWFGTQMPFVTYFPAVAVVVWLGGAGPAVAAAALGVLAANYLFLTPRLSFELAATPAVATHVAYLLASGLIVLMGEIAHRRHARGVRYREALEESESRFRLVADTAPVLIWMSDADKRGIYFNRAWLAHTGRSLEQELGDGWLESVHPDDLPALEACTEALEARRPFTTQFRLRSANGDYRWMLDSGTPRFSPDGAFLGFTGSCTDIHDRKLAEESRAWLASIVSTSNAAIVSKSLDGRILSWNAGAERIFGYTADEAVGRSIELIVPPDLIHEEHGILRRLNRGERIEDLETVRVAKDGRRVDVLLTISPVRDEAGRLVGASNVGRDVTRQKRAEAALGASEERYRAVVESQAEMLCRFRRDGTIVFVNGAYARARDAKPEDLVGTSFWAFIPESDRAEVGEMIDRLTPDAPELRIENRFETADGVRWTLWTNRALQFDADGRWTEAQSTGIDITERKRMEEALRDSEQRFARFMRHLPGLAWIKDAEGRYVFANEAAQHAFGKRHDELYGRTDAEIFPPETAAKFRANDRRALGEEAGVQDVETLIHGDGSTHHSLVSKFPIPTPDGQDLVGGVAIDITERLRAEEALRESSRRKDAFLAILGHELRNPLAPLRTGLEIVQTATADARLERVLEMMERQLHHLLRLVDDLLDVSRIGSGKLKLHSAPTGLGPVVGAAVEQAQPLIAERSHKLIVESADDALVVNGDAERLTQVFANLLTNAAKYAKDGGVIKIRTLARGDRAVVVVKDTGFGIPKTRLDTLFETFNQIEEHRAQTGGGGLGIGLALAKRIVELHGGTIEAASAGIDAGSEFTVSLPLAPARASGHAGNGGASDAPREPAGAAATATRVLIVDDNADAADTLGLLLETKGYVTETVYGGAEALEAVARFEPAVAFLDIGMPGIDGYEVAQRVRAMPGGDRIVLCAITGWGQARDKQRARDAGFDTHVTKPVDPAQLDALIAKATDARSAKREPRAK